MKSNIKHHAISALGVGLLFGAIEFVQPTESELIDYASLIRPIIFALIIWIFMVPATAITNDIFDKYAPSSINIALVLRLLIACLIGSFPLSFFIPWIANIFNLGGPVQDTSWMTVSLHDQFILTRYLKFAGVISILWILVNYRWYASQEGNVQNRMPNSKEGRVTTKTEVTEEIPDPTTTNQTPNFLQLSTKALGNKIWLISAEQHYIRVVTNAGEDLILYRFSDAVREMSFIDSKGLGGLQVHRSHWVHPEAIESIAQHNRSYLIHLKNSESIPVARSSKNLIEHAGWIKLFKK